MFKQHYDIKHCEKEWLIEERVGRSYEHAPGIIFKQYDEKCCVKLLITSLPNGIPGAKSGSSGNNFYIYLHPV